MAHFSVQSSPIKLDKGKPLFRTETGANFTGCDFNKELAFLTRLMTSQLEQRGSLDPTVLDQG
jgi:hypothetical protein